MASALSRMRVGMEALGGARLRFPAAVVLAAVLLAAPGCGGRAVRGVHLEVPVETRPSDVETRLREVVERWIGTPHCSRQQEEVCTDCSRFVATVFAEAFGMTLPSNTLDLVALGSAVKAKELRAGDLVFFEISSKTRHVGIYLRNGEFAHASTSRGVMISRIGERYWAPRFRTARRLLGAS